MFPSSSFFSTLVFVLTSTNVVLTNVIIDQAPEIQLQNTSISSNLITSVTHSSHPACFDYPSELCTNVTFRVGFRSIPFFSFFTHSLFLTPSDSPLLLEICPSLVFWNIDLSRRIVYILTTGLHSKHFYL